MSRNLLMRVMLVPLGGCASWDLGCEDLPDLINSPAGLEIVAQDEHTGWGEARCFSCHSVELMHQRNCTDIQEVDVAAIRTMVAEQGTDSCRICHGDNGVRP